MPTATSFSWLLSWNEIVGGFNAFVAMLGTPVALGIALILAFAVAGYVISLVRRVKYDPIDDVTQHPGYVDLGNGMYGLKSQWLGDDIMSIWNEDDDELVDVFWYRESD